MLRDFTIYFLTWNVAGQAPTEDLHSSLGLIKDNKKDNVLPDFYAITFQEVSVKPQKLLYDFFFDDPWIDGVKSLLSKFNYVKVKHIRLQGIVLLIFGKRQHLTSLRSIQTTYTKTGFGGAWGNKGGVSVRLSAYGCSFCFTACHLAAHDEFYSQRVLEYNTIIDTQKFIDPLTKNILAHDYVFWFGDLNFRIDCLSATEVLKEIESKNYTTLLKNDQLLKAKTKGDAFSEFSECNVNFPPTYKFHFHKHDYNHQSRKPAWTDRILYRSTHNAYENVTLSLKQISYTSHNEYSLSDHKPVSGLFQTKVFAQPTLSKVSFFPTLGWVANTDAEAWYQFNEGNFPSVWDWIGLYKSNFLSVDEHLHYVWATTVPSQSIPMPEQELQVLRLNTQTIPTSSSNCHVQENTFSYNAPWYKVVFMDQSLLVPGQYVLLYINGRFNNVLGMSPPFSIT